VGLGQGFFTLEVLLVEKRQDPSCCGGLRNAVEFCYSEIEIPREKLLNGFWKYVYAEIHRKMSNHEKEMHGVIVLERNQRALLLLFGYLVAAAVVAVTSFFSFLFVVEQRGIVGF
jgi:hypothetical protein